MSSSATRNRLLGVLSDIRRGDTSTLADDGSPLLPSDVRNRVLANEALKLPLRIPPSGVAGRIEQAAIALARGDALGEEVHTGMSQIFVIMDGSGTYSFKYDEADARTRVFVTEGDAWVVEAGTYHNVTAGDQGLKALTLYVPPHSTS
jgi:YD repeat-containing protein